MQFYGDEGALIEMLARFVRQGIESGKPLVLIATAAHRGALLRRMADEGLSAAAFTQAGAVRMLDAEEVLATFMVDGMPDRARFVAQVGEVISEAQALAPACTVRAFGEMVDLLWKQGNAAGAIRLEELWNELAATYRFTLLCAYQIGNFLEGRADYDIGNVCSLHTHVLPA